MPTPPGVPSEEVLIRIVKKDGKYNTENGAVPRIGGLRGRRLVWRIYNDTTDQILVTIHKFTPKCPVKWAGGAASERFAPRERRPIRGQLRSVVGGGVYTYEMLVTNVQSGAVDDIDPELQIDGSVLHGLLSHPLVIVTAVALLALAYWFSTR